MPQKENILKENIQTSIEKLDLLLSTSPSGNPLNFFSQPYTLFSLYPIGLERSIIVYLGQQKIELERLLVQNKLSKFNNDENLDTFKTLINLFGELNNMTVLPTTLSQMKFSKCLGLVLNVFDNFFGLDNHVNNFAPQTLQKV